MVIAMCRTITEEESSASPHFAICVDDLEHEHERLAKLASSITPIEEYVANGRRMSRYFFMRDPDGFPIEVIERN